MDPKAFFKLSYGLYIVTSKMDDKDVGCVINTMQQVTNSPERLSVAVNKENYTCQAIEKSGLFAGSVINQEVNMDLVRTFGFASSKDKDKFSGFQTGRTENGVAYIKEGMAAYFSCKVVGKVDAGTHMIFIGDVVEGEVLSDVEVMTYAYYHQVKNGKTPPKASSYQEAPGAKGWRCKVCGYVYEGGELPPDYICPVCKVKADKFEKIS